jgi:formate-dependent nitrite reductase membrane component NrfD
MNRGGNGRGIDIDLASLTGEGAQQEVDRREGSEPLPYDVHAEVPSEGEGATYYGRPALKEPVWIWSVPAYFFVGGAAGAAATLGAVAQAIDNDGLRPLIRNCRMLSAAGGALGTFFLIIDLGRPERFLNMLRVWRPSSPLNVGSWVLSATTGLAFSAAIAERSSGAVRRSGDLAGLGAGVTGIPMAGYTAVLLANSAVPLWQGTRRSMPLLFVASAVASAAALLQLPDIDSRQERALSTFDLLGSVGELAAASLVGREAARVEEVGRSLNEGLGGTLWNASKYLSLASLAVSLLPGGTAARRRVSALLGILGGLATRYAIFHAGKASSRDPRATFAMQRAGYGGKEATGRAAVTGPE